MSISFEKNQRHHETLDPQLALYHKLLDYRITEILLATLAIGTIVFFRLHR